MPIRSFSRIFCFLRAGFLILLLAFGLHAGADHGIKPGIASIPPELSSAHFIVTVNGIRRPVMHAVVGYYLLNFEINGHTRITITADDPHYWDAGVEVQPMRLGIRPLRDGASISFQLKGPAKLSITRPGDYFGDSEMLFLFANKRDQSGITSGTPGVRYFGPGVHRENIDARSGDHIYLAGGAVVFGALNFWQVHDVHVSGPGTIIYDGPQDPDHDQGWMHKPNWHAIVMDNAHNIEIEDITAIVRSRTWMVQMRDSHAVVFRNVKIIGGSAGNANQDGMDWLGGGDTLVQDSFIRAADDIFAMYGNWDGYNEEALTAPGHEVSNITVENSVLSTSISNVVRLGWPKKVFSSHSFTLRDSDVIQTGIGSCGVPFALFEVWGNPGGAGEHRGYHFENIRLDQLYSLMQLHQLNTEVRDVSFKDIWTMDGTPMVPSVLKGNIVGVTLNGVNTGIVGNSAGPHPEVRVEDGAEPPSYHQAALQARFEYTGGLLRPHRKITFKAEGARSRGLHYHWLFGDGSEADGREVHYAYSDMEGTLLDGSGRFRALLHVTDDAGHQSWSSQLILIATHLQAASDLLPARSTKESSRIFDQYIRIPKDGGYTFTLLTSTRASFAIDDLPLATSPNERPQLCGSTGNAVRPTQISAALSAGLHHLRVVRDNQTENAVSVSGNPLIYWEGPDLDRQEIPNTAVHSALDKTGTL